MRSIPGSRQKRIGGAASALLVAMVAGCGAAAGGANADTTVQAARAADGGPGSGGQGGSGGQANGSNGRDGQHGADGESTTLDRCLTRNDDFFVPPNGEGPPSAPDWYTRKAQDVFDRVWDDVGFGDSAGARGEALPRGYVDILPDEPNSRIVIIVDPTLVNLKKAAVHLHGVARRAYRELRATGPQLRVELQESCFSVKQFEGLQRYMSAHLPGHEWSAMNGPRIDSRVYLSLGENETAFGDDLQKRFGSMLVLHYYKGRGIVL